MIFTMDLLQKYDSTMKDIFSASVISVDKAKRGSHVACFSQTVLLYGDVSTIDLSR